MNLANTNTETLDHSPTKKRATIARALDAAQRKAWTECSREIWPLYKLLARTRYYADRHIPIETHLVTLVYFSCDDAFYSETDGAAIVHALELLLRLRPSFKHQN